MTHVRVAMAIFAVVFLMAAHPARGVEPCGAPVENAVRAGRLVLLGRVVKVEELKKDRWPIDHVATIVPYVCLKGSACKAKRPLLVRYVFAHGEQLTAHFFVGEEYLLSFRRDSSGPKLLFDTRHEGSCTDMAYLVSSADPAEVSRWTEADGARELTNMWFDRLSQEVTLSSLRSWASAR